MIFLRVADVDNGDDDGDDDELGPPALLMLITSESFAGLGSFPPFDLVRCGEPSFEDAGGRPD